MYQSTFSQIPKITLDYLEYGAPEGQRDDSAYKAAQQFCWNKISIDEATAAIVPRAMADGLSASQAEKCVRQGYQSKPGEPIGRGTQYTRPQARRTAPKFKKIQTAPEKLPDYIADGDRVLIEAAFEQGEFICIGTTFENEQGEINPTRGSSFTREDFIGWLAEKPINKWFTDKNGLFVRVNPMRNPTDEEEREARKKGYAIPLDTYVTSFRHALIEADKGDKEAQLGALRRIGLPITAIIDSAGRSIHAWVRIDASTREEYRERVALLHQFCRESLGLEVDPQNTNPSRYSRMPNGNRMRVSKETGEPILGDDEKPIIDQQRLLEVNVPGKSWEEWELEVRSMAAEADDERTFTVEGLLNYDLENDPSSLIGNRWVCRGSSILFIGPTGVGKSSLIMTLAVGWALEERPFGLAPVRPLKTLIIQAENDEGDLATPLQGLLSSRNLSKAKIDELNKQIIFKQVATKTGRAFADYLRAQVEKHKPDTVIADPLLSYAGCGASDQEKMTAFLRTDIQPILNETGVVLAFVHHTGKPPKKKQDADEERRTLYDSLGSTDLTNWAREVVSISYEDWENRTFKLEFQKRAKRAGLVDEDGKPIYSLLIQHSKDRVAWGIVGDKTFAGKANTKAKEQRASITEEIQEWTRETIIERGTVSQSTLRALGGQAGYPAQKVTDAAELLSDNNCGDKPIHKHKRGGVSYSIEPEHSSEASREEKKASQSRAVYDRIMELEFQTLDELKAWATSTDDAPGENSVKKFASDLIDGVNIFSDNVQIHPGKKASLVFSFGKHPMEFNEEVAKRRVAAAKNAVSDPFA